VAAGGKGRSTIKARAQIAKRYQIRRARPDFTHRRICFRAWQRPSVACCGERGKIREAILFFVAV